MITREKVNGILEGYGKDFKIATVCSHTALQIFHGARQEKIKTIGICTEERKKLYESFPLAKPDEFLVVDDAKEIPAGELVERDAILVPHGSLVEYFGKKLENLNVPVLGNRNSLLWERDRQKMFEWMKNAGLYVPKVFKPDEIDRPCIVKFPGARGGRGYIIVNSQEELDSRVPDQTGITIQEYLIGIRVYPHYFYSPLSKDGYRAGEGKVELMSIDRRVESNIDEAYRLWAVGLTSKPAFTIVGNEPFVIRESLLTEVMEMGKGVVESADRLFGGIPGPFCIEMICDENLQLSSFEISARIVAGTNLYSSSSPYSVYTYGPGMSTGRRIAVELKRAVKERKLQKIVF
jgi:5-formaminoimidazole-4-carboxamide-1-(beta)-D-ribofuranosyl 5'-monophosphate synthetase